MQPALFGDAPRNFRMAFQALEIGAAGADPMTTGALGGPTQAAMGFGKRPWRNLRRGYTGNQKEQGKANANEESAATPASCAPLRGHGQKHVR